MNYRNIINIFFHFILFFVIFIIVLELFFYAVIKRHGNDIRGRKLHVYGVLLELDNWSIFAIAAILVRFLFTMYSLLDAKAVSIIHLIVLLIISVVFAISSKRVRNFFIEVASSFAVYFGLICIKLLFGYMVDVRVEWYVILGIGLLYLFMFCYALFFLLREVNSIVSNSEYVRSGRDED